MSCPFDIDTATGRGRIFVLGDSRTGTTALHNLFARNAIKSKHYFMEEARQTDPIHVDYAGNRDRFFEYLATTDVVAFSDYPTRFFFRELHERQPEANFILTARSSTEIWRRSMDSYFGKFGIKLDIEELVLSYEEINKEIEDLYSEDRNFLKITIDEGDDNNQKIANFIGWKTYFPLTKDNAAADIDNRIWSKRFTLYGGEGASALAAIRSQYTDSKAIISEAGWCYLINDSNEFLEYQFGLRSWGVEQRDKAISVLQRRTAALSSLNVRYLKFIVPEKSVVYPEFLPKALLGFSTVDVRPASELESAFPNQIFYLGDAVRDAKSYGQLYFRGDTHTNWMGAWVVYRHIVDALSANIALGREAISYSELLPSIAAVDGDLSTQLPDALRREWMSRWDFTSANGHFENAIELSVRDRSARQVDVPAEFLERCFERRPLLYERADGQGPRAVIFTDATADILCDYLAEHFSRALFIWQDGQVFEDLIRDERPDVVVHIMAERLVSRYPEFSPLC